MRGTLNKGLINMADLDLLFQGQIMRYSLDVLLRFLEETGDHQKCIFSMQGKHVKKIRKNGVCDFC